VVEELPVEELGIAKAAISDVLQLAFESHLELAADLALISAAQRNVTHDMSWNGLRIAACGDLAILPV
jgi:hypothetical protein